MTDKSFYYDYIKYEWRIPWDAVKCNNSLCKNEHHLKSVTDYYVNLVSTLQTGSNALVRKQTVTKRCHNRKYISGWTINLSQYHPQAKVHFKEWLKCKTCKPDSNVMFKKMTSSRKKI